MQLASALAKQRLGRAGCAGCANQADALQAALLFANRMCAMLTYMIGADLQRLVLAHEQPDAVVVLVAQQLHGADAPLLPLAAALVVAAAQDTLT